MSSSAVQISESRAGALPVHMGDLEESEAPPGVGAADASLKKGVRKDLYVEVPKRRPSVDAMPSALPSPPLTRVGTNESRSTRAEVVLADERAEEKQEMDISAWRESMHRAGQEDESPLGVDEGGEQGVDEDDRFESNNPEPRGEDAWKSLSATTKDPLRSLRIGIDPNPPSPPLWEVISPPPSNDNHQYDIESQQHRFDTIGSKALCVNSLNACGSC